MIILLTKRYFQLSRVIIFPPEKPQNAHSTEVDARSFRTQSCCVKTRKIICTFN